MSSGKQSDSVGNMSLEESEVLYQRAKNVLAGGTGHDLRNAQPMPIYAARGVGCRKWDVDGNEYIDFLMGNAALMLGHAYPDVVEAIQDAVSAGTHFGNDHPLHMQWAELVQQLLPSAERVRFVNSGTEATLLAMRVARAFHGSKKVIRFEDHFHGWHDDVVHGFQAPFLEPGSLGTPQPNGAGMVTLPDGDLALVEQALETDGEIAAIIVEPTGASWGRAPLETDFLHGLRELADRFSVVLIFDEVISGFRFSPGGLQQKIGVTPDLTTLAKVVAGGMPGGAVVGRADIMKLFDETDDPQHNRFGRVTHYGTFNASPLSAAAGIATLQNLADGTAIAHADQLAQKLRTDWDAVLEKHRLAAYLYGEASTFHVYFETDPTFLQAAGQRSDLHNTEAARLKGMPGSLICNYQRELRLRGIDLMSSTGGVLSAAHAKHDVDEATSIFEEAMLALLQAGDIYQLENSA